MSGLGNRLVMCAVAGMSLFSSVDLLNPLHVTFTFNHLMIRVMQMSTQF